MYLLYNILYVVSTKKPKKDPRTNILIVIKTNNGKNANTPSNTIKIELKIGANIPILKRNSFIISLNSLK